MVFNVVIAISYLLNFFRFKVLLSTGGCGIIFALLSGQPLVIVGVSGPISIFTVTVFTICKKLSIDFLPFMSWIGIWGGIFHIAIAVINGCQLIRIVTRFSCEIFGFLIGVIFLESSIKEYIDLWNQSTLEQAFVSLLIGIGTYYLCATFHHGEYQQFENLVVF